jgi:hypothetical protein
MLELLSPAMKLAPLCLALLVLPAISWGQSTPPPALDGTWTKSQLTPNFWAEGACAADVNKDGKVDILSGPYWYEGPDFKKTHVIYPSGEKYMLKAADGKEQEVPGFQGFLSGQNKYSDNFLSYAYDCNADGWMDYVVMGFPGKETIWYENPQGKNYPWAKHVMLDVTDNESPMFVDLTGDGKPELLCMSNGFVGYAEADWTKPGEKWTWHAVSPKGAYQRFTHGIGYGDINGDGRVDILESKGWWEQPATKTSGEWKFHPALFGDGGAQMYGYDVNGDGLTDVITSIGAHKYGVAWFEQTKEGGVEGWTRHLITGLPDKPGETGVVFSQPHAIDLVDINGDGLMDIVTGKRCWAHGPAGDPESGAPFVLYWFELKREGKKASFAAHLIDNHTGVGTEVLAVDVKGDKKPDVVVGNKKGVFVHVQK